MATGKKTGGRKKGTPNRLTKEIRSALKNVIFDEIQSLPEKLSELETKDRLDLMVKLLPYVTPRVEPASYNDGEPMDWSIL